MASDGNQRLNEGELLRSMYHYLPGQGQLYCASLEGGQPPEGAAARAAKGKPTPRAQPGVEGNARPDKPYASGTWYGPGATGKGLPTYDHAHEDYRGADKSTRNVALTGGARMPLSGLRVGGEGGATADAVRALSASSPGAPFLVYVSAADSSAAAALAAAPAEAFVALALAPGSEELARGGEAVVACARAALKALGGSVARVDAVVVAGAAASSAHWAGASALLDEGLCGALGVSDIDEAALAELMGACASSSSLHAPALFAAPLCARAARRRLCGLCRRHGLALLSTAPLGEDGTDADAELPEVAEVAERFNGVDARRLLCKWSAQRGVAAVSTRAEDVAGLWDFMLAMPDKAAIDKLAKA